ncbi:hypothetical protein OG754_24900 [Streptomyces decoyicus]|uniref:hypothetical protein n=1 Tax=Streptomyces decoyicus TaxID=249567 RepID=UPI002E32390A|nr:hypothetical protein [Streptomyces decoyicus]
MKFADELWSGLKSALVPTDRHALARAAKERAAAVLPPGERVVAGHPVEAGEQLPEPPRQFRQQAFSAQRTTGDRLVDGMGRAEWGLHRLNPVNAVVDRWDDRHHPGTPQLSGGWESLAGQLAAVLRPRCSFRYLSVLLVTDQHLHVVRVRLAGNRREPMAGAEAVEYAWRVERRQVAWVRNRTDVRHGTHEAGFVDGSWVTFAFTVGGYGPVVETFPRQLRYTDPIS